MGGDFDDFHPISEGRLGVVVGDATGKRAPAALVMSTTCGMLQAVSRALGSSSPGEVLEQVNETLLARVPANMFVTRSIVSRTTEPALEIRQRGPRPALCVRRLSGEAEELRARGMPPGLMPGMSYEEKEIVLEAGDAALFYSDGGGKKAHYPERRDVRIS